MVMIMPLLPCLGGKIGDSMAPTRAPGRPHDPQQRSSASTKASSSACSAAGKTVPLSRADRQPSINSSRRCCCEAENGHRGFRVWWRWWSWVTSRTLSGSPAAAKIIKLTAPASGDSPDVGERGCVGPRPRKPSTLRRSALTQPRSSARTNIQWSLQPAISSCSELRRERHYPRSGTASALILPSSQGSTSCGRDAGCSHFSSCLSPVRLLAADPPAT